MKLTLPNNIETERAIFSIILLNPHLFITIADKLEVKDFYNTSSQEIWKTMSALYGRGDDIDIVSLKLELKKQGSDVELAMKELAKCFKITALSSNLESFVEEVKNKSLLRQIIGALYDHINSSEGDDAEAIKILGKVEKDVVRLSEQVKDDKPVGVGGILDEVRADMTKEQKSLRMFSTGLSALDARTGGFIPTHTWIIGGYTGTSKTFFTLQMILNVLKQGAKVVLFSTEMDRKMNMMRMLGNLADLGTINIIKGKLTDNEKERLKDAEKVLRGYKNRLTIYDNIYTTEEIRLKAKKQKIKNGLDIVVIDFIQNLRGPVNIYERMSNIAVDLQQMSQELEVTMVLASQVAQSSAGWSSKEAIEYKGAGEIAAVADVGLWIQRIREDKNRRRIILRKVRHGAPGRFDIKISFPSGRITSVEEQVSEVDDDDFPF